MDSDFSEIIHWLLKGDIAIQFQTKRDLLDYSENELKNLQEKISNEGWGKAFLEKRNINNGMWGNGIYSPKWISTHYTLLDLKNIRLNPNHPYYIKGSSLLLEKLWYNKGLVKKKRYQDVCICGMLLSICCYAGIQSGKIFEIVDYLINRQYADGGWNCRWEKGDVHSSMHTTLNVIEGIRDYRDNNYQYRSNELNQKLEQVHEFILKHHLFKSHRTGEIMDKKMLMLSYPTRWKYDILRCLDYFQSVNKPYDKRMDNAIEILIKKKRKNNRWPLQHKHPALVHFDMEKTGDDSRWNTGL
jgi:hypothetical protein